MTSEQPPFGGLPCRCKRTAHGDPALVVMTGGPGAGKTAVLEVARRYLCEHIAVLPEAASIVFGGGFWRRESLAARKASQRAIFHVQREMENLIVGEQRFALALCDRGTLDGLAYWPESEQSFWNDLETSRQREFQRYKAVIHLTAPALDEGYNHTNPLRIESAKQAADIDRRILAAWNGHPKRFVIESTPDFFDKAKRAVELIRAELPDCCRTHEFPEFEHRPEP